MKYSGSQQKSLTQKCDFTGLFVARIGHYGQWLHLTDMDVGNASFARSKNLPVCSK
jgi:hypothetical protein